MGMIVKDKVAVVFHGIVGGMGGRNGIGQPNNISDCAKTIKYNILSRYDCDVFVHSWSVDHSEEITNLYKPVLSLFQPQEYFGFSINQATDAPIEGQAFRSTSRYVSLERVMALKRQYEINQGFRYKWVLALRYDLVVFRPLRISEFDPQFMYICSEPHWEQGAGLNNSLYHDIIFLSNSDVMNKLGGFGTDLLQNKFNGRDIHSAICNKIKTIFGFNEKMIKRLGIRYIDLEIYRMVINPDQNPVGHAYGALECKGRLEELLKIIDKSE